MSLVILLLAIVVIVLLVAGLCARQVQHYEKGVVLRFRTTDSRSRPSRGRLVGRPSHSRAATSASAIITPRDGSALPFWTVVNRGATDIKAARRPRIRGGHDIVSLPASAL
jgi:hypothetical protein